MGKGEIACCDSVFKRLVLLTRLFGKELNDGHKHFILSCNIFKHVLLLVGKLQIWWLNPFPNKPWFLRVRITSLLKTLWEKEKLLVTSNFSFSHSVFYLFGELPAIFIKFEIDVCKLFQFERVQNLSFGKGLTVNLITKFKTCPCKKVFVKNKLEDNK